MAVFGRKFAIRAARVWSSGGRLLYHTGTFTEGYVPLADSIRSSSINKCRVQAEFEFRKLFIHRNPSFRESVLGDTYTKLANTKEDASSLLPHTVARSLCTQSARLQSSQRQRSEQGITKQEDPFDSITDKIPERPVTIAEGASYSVVILAGLAIAAAAAYAVFKELIFEPKEYKIFGKALDRVQHDSQVSVRLGAPITGYGQESRNRAARQRISNRAWTDEDGVDRIEVMFYIRGSHGAGKVYCEMFKDKDDRTWKYTYLIVDVTAPSPSRLMLESYMPASPLKSS